MEKKYRGLISRTKKEIKELSGKSKEGKEKFLDDYQFILDLLKKTASIAKDVVQGLKCSTGEKYSSIFF
jgi:hypothetical protein